MITIRILLCALGCVAPSLYAMHNTHSQVLKPWVQNATTIRIESLTKLLVEDFSIDNTTTIAQVKRFLKDSEGIPVEYQRLMPMKMTSFLWVFTKRQVVGEELTSDRQIKDVMNAYDANALRLYLTNRASDNRIGAGEQ